MPGVHGWFAPRASGSTRLPGLLQEWLQVHVLLEGIGVAIESLIRRSRWLAGIRSSSGTWENREPLRSR